MKVLIDNGHGFDTKGKCSPDKRLMEWSYNREIAREVVRRLCAAGMDAELIVKEDRDVSLSERVKRVNTFCRQLGASDCVLVSIHVNAAGCGAWLNARGWSGWVAPNASEASKRLARLLYDEAAKRGLQGNRSVPPEKFWVGNFTVLTRSMCPAVLTENLFQDNREDVEFLLSLEGREAVIDLHTSGISSYVQMPLRL